MSQIVKNSSRLRRAFHKAVAPDAPWHIKAVRVALLATLAYPALQLSLMGFLPGRPLTAGERLELSAVFQGAVSYDRVRIHSSKAMDFWINPFAGKYTDTTAEGHTRGNVIILAQAGALPDYAADNIDPYRKEIMLHESVHVWQYQNCRLQTLRAALKGAFNSMKGLEAVYEYKLGSGKDLLDYPLEQQATLITDYYLNVRNGLAPGFAANAGNIATLAPLYEKTLRQFRADPSYLSRACHKLK